MCARVCVVCFSLFLFPLLLFECVWCIFSTLCQHKPYLRLFFNCLPWFRNTIFCMFPIACVCVCVSLLLLLVCVCVSAERVMLFIAFICILQRTRLLVVSVSCSVCHALCFCVLIRLLSSYSHTDQSLVLLAGRCLWTGDRRDRVDVGAFVDAFQMLVTPHDVDMASNMRWIQATVPPKPLR